MKQWEDSIIKVCPTANIQILKGKNSIIEDECDFYIVNAINVEKFKPEVFKNI